MAKHPSGRIPVFPELQVNEEMAKKALEPLSNLVDSGFSIADFVQDLNQSREAFLLRAFQGSEKIWKIRRAKLNEIVQQANELGDLLDLREGGGWLKIALGHLFPTGSRLDKYDAEYDSKSQGRYNPERPTLSQMASAIVELGRMKPQALTVGHYYVKGSVFEWFVGYHLANLFEKHFNRRPGIIKERGYPPRGAFLDFAVGIIRLLGIKRPDRRLYTLETIASAFGRTHRKNLRRESGEREDRVLGKLRKIRVASPI